MMKGVRPAAAAVVLAGVLVAGALTAACSATPIPTRQSRPTSTPAGGSATAATGTATLPTRSISPTTPFDPAGRKVDVALAVSGLINPLDVTNAADGSGRLFIAEQAGRIRIVQGGTLVDRPFLDIKARITSGGERGLLGLAFHPHYPTDPRFFVDYTDLKGDTVVSQFRVTAADPGLADPNSETVLLHIAQPFANHNGGAVEFGPDGMLYIGMGDGGSAGDPQRNGGRLDTLLAKILRIDVDVPAGAATHYQVPTDNPFLGIAGAKPEIWLTGLRNPWRMRFDRKTGDLWIGDVGQAAWEEIDVARSGASGLDYGWSTMEGFHCFEPPVGCDRSGLRLPLAEYGHNLGCAVIGGVVVRDPAQASLVGGYLFGDACSDNLWLMDPAGDGRREPVIVSKMGRSISSIGEAEDGSVYATSLAPGEVLRITAPGG
jgi:glucose/arabinose dehydrogenase